MTFASRLISVAQAWFGHFSRDELKKFVLLGVIYGFIIGIYWTLRVTKDSVFMTMIGGEYLNSAKLLSLWCLFPLILLYTKIVEKYSRNKLLFIVSGAYIVGTLLFGMLLLDPSWGLANREVALTRWLGWAWYAFVESYGSFVPALFWAFATDTTDPDSARRGFPFSVMIAQSISVFGPALLTPLAAEHWFGSTAYVVLASGIVFSGVLFFLWLFEKTVPKSQLVGYRPAQIAERKQPLKNAGFAGGLRLFFSSGYLLGILSIVAAYETVTTLIDYNFKNMAQRLTCTDSACTVYLGSYATLVNLVSAVILIFGVNNVQRRLGIRFSILVMPFVVAVALGLFFFYPKVQVLFWVMIGVKALAYAINSPSVKQLYVPTSTEVKYLSQAWIDTFGSRASKTIGSGFAFIQSPLAWMFGPHLAFELYVNLSVGFSSILIISWFLMALYLGRRYTGAVANKEIVC